jgi:DNA-binding transcriptional regulator YiaG
MSRVAVARHLGMSVHAYERWEDGRISLARARSRRLLENFIREEAGIDDSARSQD